mmetsp:Transcript_13521/g.59079  ORF Transcript_13521/g.59079 Transcript_13521/m.59079 type:complete len:239 (-) Transcript_13521:603-1319(-)
MGTVLNQSLTHRLSHKALTCHRVGFTLKGVRPTSNGFVVHPTSNGAEEIQRLVGVSLHQSLHGGSGHVVIPIHRVYHVAYIFSGRRPIEFVHAPVTEKRCVKCGEIVSGYDDGHAADVLVVPVRVDLVVLLIGHEVWMVTDVHKSSHHHLRIHCGLRLFEPSHARVDVVDDQAGCLAANLHDLSSVPVPASDQPPGFTRPFVLEFARRHHHWMHAKRLARELEVERLAAPLRAPDAED